jgi:hypothetical protein
MKFRDVGIGERFEDEESKRFVKKSDIHAKSIANDDSEYGPTLHFHPREEVCLIEDQPAHLKQ